MKKNGAALLLILASVLFGCAKTPPYPNALDSQWDYSIGTTGDTPLQASQYNYKPINNLRHLERFFPEKKGILWLRNKFITPDQARSEKLAIILGVILPAERVYLNGYFLGGYGSFPEENVPFFSDWNRYRIYSFNRSLLNETNTLLVKINITYEGGIHGLKYFGNYEDIQKMHSVMDFFYYKIHLLIFSLILFIVFYASIIYIIRPKDKSNLYYCAASFFLAVFEINFFVTRVPIPLQENIEYFLFQKIVYSCIGLSSLFLILFANTFASYRPSKLIKRMTYSIALSSSIFIILIPNYRMMVLWGKLIISYPALYLIVYIIFLSIRSWRQNTIGKILIFGFMPFFACIIFDTIAHVILKLTGTPYLSGIGFSSTILAFAFIQAGRFVHFTHEAEKVNRSLQDKINEKEIAELALKIEKERLSITFLSIADGVISTNDSGKITFLNRAAEKILGVREENVREKHISSVLSLKDNHSGEQVDILKDISGSFRSDLIYSKNNIDQIISLSCAPISPEKNLSHGYILIIRDITNQRKFQEELQKIQKLESIGVIAGGIAHDFNNFLTAIMGNIDLALLQISQEKPDVIKILQDAGEACLNARGLTHQLLTFAQGGLPIKKAGKIDNLIKKSAEFILSGSSIHCIFNFPGNLSPVLADNGLIGQVIQNLVLNAAQAMKGKGTIKISAENISENDSKKLPIKENKYVHILIRDYGPGIPEENLGRIFDPFFSTKENGSGLGLSSTYSILKKHDGYIFAKNTGNGSEFSIFIPAHDAEIEDNIQIPQSNSGSEGRIIFMDDDENISKVAVKMLQSLGHSVTATSKGEETIQEYRKAIENNETVNCVILDLTIKGGMGGLETMKKLQNINPSVTAIVSSGYSNNPVMSNYEAYGFKAMIAKPYRLEDLKQTLDEILLQDNS